ncbi:MAG: alpha/beta hydrolase, partial [Verrucomicrobia bacterium]|nr:alpha/beta hydrolase [Verrucomicrobiota bacterium]
MKFVKTLLKLVAIFLLCVVGFIIWGWWYVNPDVERKNDVIYTQRNGHDLSYDILRPADKSDRNNIAILLMNSGSWESDEDRDRLAIVAPLIRRGYTVFSLSHLSQPKASVMEIVEDINRAVRHIRHHADEYKINPDRIGVTGGSSGGHLSLMLATLGGPGPDDAQDPIDRQSSAIQAAAIFFPVTDLLNLGDSTENLGDGGPPKSYVKAFGPHSTDLEVWKVTGRNMSPIYHIKPDLPPI